MFSMLMLPKMQTKLPKTGIIYTLKRFNAPTELHNSCLNSAGQQSKLNRIPFRITFFVIFYNPCTIKVNQHE